MPRDFVKRLTARLHARRHLWYLRIFGERLTDPQIWSLTHRSIAAACGAGVAIAFIPLPIHTVTAVLVAIWIRINLPVVLAATWIVNPLTIVPIYLGAYRVGALLLHTPDDQFHFQMSWRWLEHGLGPMWEPFLLGCLVCGVICSLAARTGLNLLWRAQAIRRYRTRHARRRGH